jgi:tyrosine-protein phosphatase OCA6
MSSSKAALPPLVPPLRFSLVEEGIYRGAYPSLINLRFLARLGLKSMVSLLPEAPAPHLVRWCEENGIINHAERIAVPREGTGEQEVTFTHERIADLLQLLVMPERQPVYVHCLDGVGITGTLIMCLRRLQRWSAPPFVAEYARFARDGLEVPTPPPQHVLSFVHAFKPELEFARLDLPARLPFWLDAALSASAVGGGGRHASAADGSMLGTGGELGHDLVARGRADPSRERGGAERDGRGLGLARHHGDGGDALAAADPLLSHDAAADKMPFASARRGALSAGLDALALEGLTMGQRAPLRVMAQGFDATVQELRRDADRAPPSGGGRM